MAVSVKASEVSMILDEVERPLLVAAAWLHDIAYAPEVIDTGLHALGGARWLPQHGYGERVVALVAHHSCAILTADADEAGNVSTRVRLLAAVRTAFTVLGDPPAASTHDLLAALNGDEEAPWAGFGPAGLTGKRLGDLLREFGIISTTIQFPSGRRRATPERPSPTPGSGTVPPHPYQPYQHRLRRANPGTDTTPGTDQSVPVTQPVPRLNRQNELGTAGTGNPWRPSQTGNRFKPKHGLSSAGSWCCIG
ncbi:DUF3631 domain-containing protein [Micromonospora ureilytica]|uniref:DUF3631 domain-containing protein n=1 Tax=Micromonospora ureilytica TaxID=709868 RepID=A0ABS0J9M8_9ACTN|nr:DUF3631 domain-containing protein [Micromonospora ureilytica]MBG6063752.1 hypothetical protein [Micromonospora ureilytica]